MCSLFILYAMHAAMRTHIHHRSPLIPLSVEIVVSSPFPIQLVKNCIRHLRRHSQKYCVNKIYSCIQQHGLNGTMHVFTMQYTHTHKYSDQHEQQ